MKLEMEQLIIRKAVINDLDTLRVFEQGVIEAERPFDSTLKDGHIHYYNLEEMINVGYIELLVAEVNDRIIASGYARIEESKLFYKHTNYAYLGFMYVLPAYRGKGINNRIIEALQQWSLSQNINELRLEVYFDNLPAITAYEKAGFSKYIIQMRLGI